MRAHRAPRSERRGTRFRAIPEAFDRNRAGRRSTVNCCRGAAWPLPTIHASKARTRENNLAMRISTHFCPMSGVKPHRRITLGIALPVTDSGAAKSRFADDKSGNAYRDCGCGWQVKNQRARTQRQGRKVSKNVQAVEQSAEGQLSCGFHLIHDAIFFALGVLRFRIPAAACL